VPRCRWRTVRSLGSAGSRLEWYSCTACQHVWAAGSSIEAPRGGDQVSSLKHVLVVDDDTSDAVGAGAHARRLSRVHRPRRDGGDGDSFRARARRSADHRLSDAGHDGEELTHHARATRVGLKVLVITGHAHAVEHAEPEVVERRSPPRQAVPHPRAARSGRRADWSSVNRKETAVGYNVKADADIRCRAARDPRPSHCCTPGANHRDAARRPDDAGVGQGHPADQPRQLLERGRVRQAGRRAPACVFYDADLCKNDDFTLALYTPYKSVAYEVWRVIKNGQPAPTPSYSEAQRTRVTVASRSPKDSKNTISGLLIKRGGKTIEPTAGRSTPPAANSRSTSRRSRLAPASRLTLPDRSARGPARSTSPCWRRSDDAAAHDPLEIGARTGRLRARVRRSNGQTLGRARAG